MLLDRNSVGLTSRSDEDGQFTTEPVEGITFLYAQQTKAVDVRSSWERSSLELRHDIICWDDDCSVVHDLSASCQETNWVNLLRVTWVHVVSVAEVKPTARVEDDWHCMGLRCKCRGCGDL